MAEFQFSGRGQQTVGSIVTQCDSDSISCRIVAGGVGVVKISGVLRDAGAVRFGSWTGV